jgi:hypothetical protein
MDLVGHSQMQASTPEDRAAEFARRHFTHESEAMREMAKQEIAKLIREASQNAQRLQSR